MKEGKYLKIFEIFLQNSLKAVFVISLYSFFCTANILQVESEELPQKVTPYKTC